METHSAKPADRFRASGGVGWIVKTGEEGPELLFSQTLDLKHRRYSRK